jgi:hypothetical protein
MMNEPSMVRMFEAMADRVRAGEAYDAVLYDYGLKHADSECHCTACCALCAGRVTPEEVLGLAP